MVSFEDTRAVNSEIPMNTTAVNSEIPMNTTAVNSEIPMNTTAVNSEIPMNTTAVNSEIPMNTTAVNSEIPMNTTAVNSEKPMNTTAVNSEIHVNTTAVNSEIHVNTTAVNSEIPTTSTSESICFKKLSLWCYLLFDTRILKQIIDIIGACPECLSKVHIIHDVLSKKGLAHFIKLLCTTCKWTCKWVCKGSKEVRKCYYVNIRSVIALREIDKGYISLKTFCGLRNMPPPMTRKHV